MHAAKIAIFWYLVVEKWIFTTFTCKSLKILVPYGVSLSELQFYFPLHTAKHLVQTSHDSPKGRNDLHVSTFFTLQDSFGAEQSSESRDLSPLGP